MESVELPSVRFVLGRVLANRYLVEELLEETSAAASYRAYHLALDRTVLLRVLAGRPGLTRGLCLEVLRRAREVAPGSDPSVSRCVDVGLLAERWPFVVSLDGAGRSLRAELADHGPFSVGRLLRIARSLSGALAAAHERGLVHGALSLDQIWLEARSESQLKLLGWGLSALPPARSERPGSGVFATAARQARALGERQCDIRALGAVLYQLATGKAPVWSGGDVASILDSDLAGQGWTAERALTRGFALVLKRCLYLSPDTHYESASQAARDLDQLLQSRSAICDRAKLAPLPIRHVVAAPSPKRGRMPSEPKVIVRGG